MGADQNTPVKPLLGSLRFNQNDQKPYGGLNPYSHHFINIGKTFHKLLIEHINLTKSCRLLDVGCGSGRLSLQLENWLHYVGFDINLHFVSLAQNYSRNIDLFDIHHEEFNPFGSIDPMTFEFPYSTPFDAVIAIAVFNHFRVEWLDNYFKQIARVLKRNGSFFGTFILLNDQSKLDIDTKSNHKFTFDHRTDDGWYHTVERPLLNVAISENYIRRKMMENKLSIIEPIRYGEWRQSGLAITGHDVIIAKKR